MKIQEYPETTELSPNDVFIVDNDEDGTRKIKGENLNFGEGGGGSILTSNPDWISHRNTYRGKDLGSIYTDEQQEAVASGTFNDLYVGDYWTINGIRWQIADINYLQLEQEFNIATKENHLIIVPADSLTLTGYPMNSTKTNASGYIGSKMRSSTIPTIVAPIIYAAFNSNNIMEYLGFGSNGVTNNYVTGNTQYTASIELMNTAMVNGWKYYYDKGVFTPTTQLALFRLKPSSIVSTTGETINNYWLQDIINSTFLSINRTGRILISEADVLYGIRPFFALKGTQ